MSRPTDKARFEKLGFTDVTITKEGGKTFVTALLDGFPVRITAYPEDDIFDVARGYVSHLKH